MGFVELNYITNKHYFTGVLPFLKVEKRWSNKLILLGIILKYIFY